MFRSIRQTLSRTFQDRQKPELDYRESWTSATLQRLVKNELGSPEVIVVSNREPYVHHRGADGGRRVEVPASGMVTALEPIVRACGGVWVAHGSGSADREVVDLHDRIRVPPEDPAYALKRVWLRPEEEQGYYCGFSNEGLWPLCHLAYVRPVFREADWDAYRSVNQQFATSVIREARRPDPVILIQDYHLALLARLIRHRKANATIAHFWHIPWPSAETFGVCPWKDEIMRHLLAADIVGFHTRQYCLNFLATAEQLLECRVDHERMTVTLEGHVCRVSAYPISIEWPAPQLEGLPSVAVSRARIRRHHGIAAGVHLGVGVERWDFTKGIVERFHALESLLIRRPDLRGRVALLQVAAPSRTTLAVYQALQSQTLAETERINARFGSSSWKPIVLVDRHQSAEQVFELFRAADFCLVNSLHDGMNLVSKEFVAARDDEDGVLILSAFTGAARELLEALLVNPFCISETAAAIEAAITMPREERRERMRLMRRTVSDNNVYRWAGSMLLELAQVRRRQSLPADWRMSELRQQSELAVARKA
ncbi:MAG TPA: trehalose-6-phosphate synthase [Steroidobacteraceae bacterium]|nr:trehalose-6-phosphate synthase [Steroidobacteraceae bacterium]